MKSDWTNPVDVMRWVIQGKRVHCSSCKHQHVHQHGVRCGIHTTMKWTIPQLPHSDGHYCCLDWKSRD